MVNSKQEDNDALVAELERLTAQRNALEDEIDSIQNRIEAIERELMLSL